MAETTLLFPLISGLLLLAIVAGVLRLRGWRRGVPTGGRSATPSSVVVSTVNSPTTWTVLFFLLVLGGVAGALGLVGAISLPEGSQGLVVGALLAGFGLSICGLLFGGVYGAVRSRGHGTAPAVGLGSIVVGLFLVVVIVLNLFLA